MFLVFFFTGASKALLERLPGDTDCDGAIDISGLVRFRHYYHGQELMLCRLADVNQDGATNVTGIATIVDACYGD